MPRSLSARAITRSRASIFQSRRLEVPQSQATQAICVASLIR